MNQTATAENPVFEHVQQADSPLVMTAIYEPQINLAVWQRQLPTALQNYITALTQGLNALQLRTVIAPAEVGDWLTGLLPEDPQRYLFIDDVRQLAEMYADLFELNTVGLRLSLINETMCPRFHTDHLICRMVTTYHGHGSEWLREENVDRSKLGAGAKGLADHLSGIYRHHSDIQQLQPGEVALLKGDGWMDSQVSGIVHRSPHIHKTEKRLLLTLDFAE
ncbi:DUF1826 domain-containing protein [Methylophaga sp.]|uniref:DUF1826 domain-containing protein n=1 Tax=Methylophaga sp. TaxID=2024840 RepID=UPI002716BBBC|nr:DUF1826 domain-containing protein [Methylophaga sp.]MDO8825502.1 DUF1826 domain-containing protein [Methylophaga sp.]